MAVERLQGCKAANCMTFFFGGEMSGVGGVDIVRW